jgi:hypothetical protein
VGNRDRERFLAMMAEQLRITEEHAASMPPEGDPAAAEDALLDQQEEIDWRLGVD